MIATVRAIIAAAALSHGVSVSLMDGMAYCESTWNPVAVNGPNMGLFQLSRYGKLQDFYAQGYTDWTDPAQQSDFTALQLVAGEGRAWTCFRLLTFR